MRARLVKPAAGNHQRAASDERSRRRSRSRRTGRTKTPASARSCGRDLRRRRARIARLRSTTANRRPCRRRRAAGRGCRRFGGSGRSVRSGRCDWRRRARRRVGLKFFFGGLAAAWRVDRGFPAARTTGQFAAGRTHCAVQDFGEQAVELLNCSLRESPARSSCWIAGGRRK